MSNIELSIHTAAPSIVETDERWRDIARKTMNFEGAKLTKVASIRIALQPNDASGQGASTSTEDSLSSTNNAYDTEQQQTRNSGSVQQRQILKRKRNVGNNIPFKRSKQGLNPAYKTPLLSKAQITTVETPRPRSAPETTILVPFTEQPRHRRSRSDESQLRSTDSLSPPEGFNSSRVHETSLPESPTGERRSRPSTGTTGQFTNNSFERHRFPGNQEHLAALRRNSRSGSSNDDVSLQLSQTSLNEADLTMGTRRHTQSSDDGDVDALPPDPSMPTQSSDRTASVSPTELRKFQSSSSPLLQRSNHVSMPTPVIDLTGELEETPHHVTHRDLLGPVSSPIRGSLPSNDFEEVFAKIKSLPQNIKCAATNTNSKQQFTTCITPNLAELADQFDLVNKFQLCAATGNVENRKRGYWQLLISIDDVASSARTHASSLTSSQWGDRRFMIRQEGEMDASATTPEREAFVWQTKYPPKDPKKPVTWSADDFFSFWAVLTKSIERGRAGYDSFAEFYRRERTEHGILLKLRMWCWGEVLAHTWLLLYAASNGLIANVPAQWWVPNFKKYGIVLTMSGQPKNPGNVGRWVERRSGPDGSWGLEQSWDGIESAERSEL